MATEILNPKVEAIGLLDIAGMLIAKRVVDGVAMPIVGNNNLVSGIAKVTIGGLMHGKGGRIGNMVTGGIVLDGVDDFAGIVMQKMNIGGNAGAQAQQQAVNPGL